MDLSALRERNTPSPFTVTELNTYIKSLFDSDSRLTQVTVRGEISNLVVHTSGHLYFSLKDEEGQVRAVMFRSAAVRLRFQPKDGMRVILFGTVSVYTKGGSYQIYVNAVQPDGIGALYLAYEQLKERLGAEGLFAAEHKRPIPRFPQRIGVITSPTGAAVRDILHITARRFPMAEIRLYPALVQGDGAVASLLRGLAYFERTRTCDTVIIGRGGGSIEDLWAFNDEALARKIYEMTIPVISAVGHEIDFTICDLVADLRAPTPSAAAELAVPDRRELLLQLDRTAGRLDAALIALLQRRKERLLTLARSRALTDPTALFAPYGDRLSHLSERSRLAMCGRTERARNTLCLLAEKANAMSPLAVLSRGYCVPEREGRAVVSATALFPGDGVTLRFADGSVDARVESRLPENEKKIKDREDRNEKG